MSNVTGIVDTRQVVGAENYLVDSNGDVYSTKRNKIVPRKLSTFYTTNRIVVSIDYDLVGKKLVSVARIVLEAFVGPAPTGYVACHFPDSDIRNNKLSNLMWGTPKTNSSHRRIHGTMCFGSKNGNSVLTEELVIALRADAEKDRSRGYLKRLMAEYDIGYSTVYDVIMRKIWKHI